MEIKELVYECRLFILILLSFVPLEAVTVSPALCPTNKIAPHKRHAGWEYGTGRTFGAFYDLLTPGGGHYGPQFEDNNLQEQPQEDDPNDCGEIDDYDENDLSSVTAQNNRRQGYANRYFFGSPQNQHHRPPSGYPERPPQYPHRPPNSSQRPPNYPQRPPNFPQRPPNSPQRPPNSPQRPSRPARPPYWSGGLFGSNDYRPPSQLYPSDNIKPIHEYSDGSDVTYRPTVVGGALGHVVGVSPVVPSTEPPTPRPEFVNPLRGSSHPGAPDYSTAQRRPRLNTNRTVLGSFVDLFFK